MVNYCETKVSSPIWLNCFTYKCNSCGEVFNLVFSNGYDLVEFEEINGGDIKYMPSYGKGGYLDLMTKLIPDHSQDEEITMQKTDFFIKELNKHCEKGSHGNDFGLRRLVFECSKCKSKDITLLKEDVLVSPEVSWLKIDCRLLE